MPWEALLGIAVFDENMVIEVKTRLQDQVETPYLKVCRDWYYGD